MQPGKSRINPSGKVLPIRDDAPRQLRRYTQRQIATSWYLCQAEFPKMGRHYQTAKQPLHPRHLRRPSDPILARMKLMQAEYNIVLPLDAKAG